VTATKQRDVDRHRPQGASTGTATARHLPVDAASGAAQLLAVTDGATVHCLATRATQDTLD